jgi:hypothetical protein
MDHPRTDAEVAGLVRRSGVFRAARAGLTTLDASLAGSALIRALPRSLTRRTLAVVLLAASLTHGALEALLPAVAAPAGRYSFAVAGAIAAAILLAGSRRR